MRREVDAKKNKCNVFIEPVDCAPYNIMDLGEGEKIFQTGYNAAMKMKVELLMLK